MAAIDGIPSTRGERIVIDIAARRGRPSITQLVDEAISSGVCVRRRLFRRAEDLGNGRAGVGLICRLTHPDAAAEFRSWLERRAASNWRLRGVPSPSWNVPVSDARGKIGEVDPLWAWRPLIVELEAALLHRAPRQPGCGTPGAS